MITKHSHRAWILVDPMQDHEESTVILGVYSKDRAARYAARAYMRREPHRDIEAQEWRGGALLRVWTWNWRTRRWTMCYRSKLAPCTYHNHAEMEAARMETL